MAKPKMTPAKKSVIEAALLRGDATFADLSAEHGIAVPTLYAWFPGGPRKYALARRLSKQLGLSATQLIRENPGNVEAFLKGVKRYRRKAA